MYVEWRGVEVEGMMAQLVVARTGKRMGYDVGTWVHTR